MRLIATKKKKKKKKNQEKLNKPNKGTSPDPLNQGFQKVI
jgi:hypothetical protein